MAFPEVTAQLSPMMRQYIEVKKQHPDKLLMYRLGDFYELFFDDAVTASRELELVLTGRDCGLPQRAPMCGVPYHAVDGYVSRLVEKGYKVVICEQMEDPAKAKGLVKRDIVRIVTPGTLTDTDVLEDSRNNYAAAVYIDGSRYGAAFADISTGELHVTEGEGGLREVLLELSRYLPREVLCNSDINSDSGISAFFSKNTISFQRLSAAYFDADSGARTVTEQFDADTVKSLGVNRHRHAVSAAGALIRYIGETQFSGLKRLCSADFFSSRDYMLLPESCRRNLEITETMRSGERRGSLLWAIDRTSTSMGKRLLRTFLEKPLLDPVQINLRLDAVEEFNNNSVLCAQLSDSLKGVFDLERLMTRIMYGKCTPRDLIAFSATSVRLGEIKVLSASFRTKLLRRLASAVDTLDDLKEEINSTIADDPPALLKDGGYIRQGRNPEIDELRELLHDSKSYLAKLEQSTKEKTGIKNLRVGYNRVFGYYFEVSKSNIDSVPDYFIRKQTLTTGERYITEELKDLENRILSAGERLDLLERDLYDRLCQKLTDNLQRVQDTSYAVAYIDVLCALGELARDNGYCRPEVDSSDVIRITSGRHPVVELVLRDEMFVPNDTNLDCRNNLVNLITGPNMAGKSTYMRQVALITILAQIGSFVPAASARIGVVDSIYTRVGASDDLFSGDSTFMVEMKEVAEILENAGPGSLVILDEIGRGTSTYDGMSIARSVIEYICSEGGIGCKTMFATHYHELTDMDADFSNLKNYNIAAKKRGDTITFLRRIVEGPADDSYGIEVANLAGVPSEVTDRAKEILASLEEKNPDRIERRIITTSVENTSEIEEELSRMHIEAITPLEAMGILDKLIKAARKKRE